jgi:hypothetical protein
MDFFGKAVVSASVFCGGKEPVVITARNAPWLIPVPALREKAGIKMAHKCLGIAVRR